MELNREQIKKALEYHSDTDDNKCEVCPYNRECCSFALASDALALINSQEQRIKDLTNENAELKNQLQGEISEEDIDLFDEFTKLLHEGIRDAKAETVRKMQERLTTFFANDDYLRYNEVDADYINECIDQIAKEMLEGKNNVSG